MLTQPTIDKLKTLHLETLAAAWLAQQKQPDVSKLAFDERFALLVEAEWLARENKRMARCLKEVKVRLNQACVEDIDFAARRELATKLLERHPGLHLVQGICDLMRCELLFA